MKLAVLFFALLPLVAYGQQPTGALLNRVKTTVGAELKDPYSAVYSDMKVFKTEGKTNVCGFVNAKNSFGGYVGKKEFFYVDHPSEPAAILDPTIVPVLCAAKTPQGAARNKAEAAKLKEEEVGALCGPETSMASTGECGRLYAECTLEAKNFTEPTRTKFMTNCRRKGVAFAMEQWEASSTGNNWPAPPPSLSGQQ